METDPTPKRTKKPAATVTADVFEEYEGGVNSDDVRDELAAQPWSQPSDGGSDLGETTTVKEMKGGGLKITEGKRTFVMRPGAEGRVLVESDDGDGNTFVKTLYSEGGLAEGYLNNYQRVLAMRQSLIMYRDDPYYRAIIDGFVFFIIGKGVSFKALDENPAMQQHLEDFWKENKMKGRDAEIVRRYLKFGEVLIRYFKNSGKGALAKSPRVRLIPFWRLDELKIDADDPEQLSPLS